MTNINNHQGASLGGHVHVPRLVSQSVTYSFDGKHDGFLYTLLALFRGCCFGKKGWNFIVLYNLSQKQWAVTSVGWELTLFRYLIETTTQQSRGFERERKKRKSKLIPYFLLTTVFQKSETLPPCFNKFKRNLQFTSFYSFGLILKTCTGNNIISPTTGKRNVASSTVSEIRPGHIFTSSHVYDVIKRYYYVESKHILKECSMLL